MDTVLSPEVITTIVVVAEETEIIVEIMEIFYTIRGAGTDTTTTTAEPLTTTTTKTQEVEGTRSKVFTYRHNCT